MPTPVNAARQCLTEEAARVLDDAVAVARRRNHGQTTSLHAVSALLASPSSKLREACTRAGSSSYSPRLQLKALELSVGVSLDRLPTSKPVEEDPPVSNSLMAAIKRSQANQRRHPESFYLFQMHSLQNQQQQQTASLLKVELKHFVLSILDDPIVSRVFGDAGFRSCDVKLSLLQPPVTQTSRFSRSRYPPIFLCNLPGSESGPSSLKFPFMGNSGPEGVDGNCRRIAQVLVRKTRRNPLLMGIYARNALWSFTESVQRCRQKVLPDEIAGLNVLSIEEDVSEILEGGSEEKMGLKFKELSRSLEQCSGPGIAVNFGELDAFVRDGVPPAASSFVVSQLTSLLKVHGEKIWVVGIAGTSDVYSKFVALFPTIEKDWDLYLLTITSATPSMEGLYPKSSLMGSFVPFGGFFSSPSELKSPLNCANQSLTRCHACNQKYEQEVADVLKEGPATLASGYPTNLPWSQKASVETDQGLDVAKSNEENATTKIFRLQKKWSDYCESLHQTRSIPETEIGTSQTMSEVPILGGFPLSSSLKESSSKHPSFNERQHSHDVASVRSSSNQVAKVSEVQHTDKLSPWINHFSKASTMLDGRSSSPLASVATDLALGTMYASTAQVPNTQENHKEHLQDLNDNNFHQIAGSSSCSGPSLEGKFNSLDFKSLCQVLTERVGWQEEAISAIIQTLSLCKSGRGKHQGLRVRTDIWLAFLGPDRFGKRKIASILAKTIFGNTESLIYLDLNAKDQDRAYPLNSIFESQNSNYYEMRRKTDVGFIAGELSKKPHAVVYLENVDKADFMVQNSLLQALRTGKFPDTHGREISIHNAILIVSSTVSKGNDTFLLEKEPEMFSEEIILEAKRFQMQLLLRDISEDANGRCGPNVIVTPRKGSSKQTFLNKRKQVEISEGKEQATCSKIPKQVQEATRSYLDLNMPVEEVEDDDMDHNDCEDESKIEDDMDDNDCEDESKIEGDMGHNDSENGSKNEGSQAWLNDFCDQTDEKVDFKPLNFDVLAGKIQKSISIQFERTFGSQFLLEIDYEVMTQILAAAWISDKKNAVEDWIEHVLGKSFNEAKQKYYRPTKFGMKLVSCEGILVEEQVPGVCLPARINLN